MTTTKFEMTVEDCSKAIEFLLKMGYTKENIRDMDGYSIVYLANYIVKTKGDNN
jgi:hypothetical protein